MKDWWFYLEEEDDSSEGEDVGDSEEGLREKGGIVWRPVLATREVKAVALGLAQNQTHHTQTHSGEE